MHAAESALNNNVRVGEAFAVRDIAWAGESARAIGEADILMRRADGLGSCNRDGVVNHHGVNRERRHDGVGITGVLGGEVDAQQRAAAVAFLIVNAADNHTVRTVMLIGPDKKIKAMIAYPMTTGRNFDEVLRVLDSLQLLAKHNVATPVNWWPGQDVIIPPSVSDADAKAKFPQGWKTLKPHLRVVAQPQ